MKNKILAVVTCLALSSTITAGLAHEPKLEKARFALDTSYLQSADYGIYESVYNAKYHKVFSAVIDRVRKADNLGFLNQYNPDTLALEASYKMPYRIFSLTQSDDGKFIFAGHTQHMMLSKIDANDGTVLVTTSVDKLPKADQKGHMRHLVYSAKTNKIYVTAMSDGLKLLVFNAANLAYEGEIKGAYPSTAFGLNIDRKTGLIYTVGSFINVIDPVKGKVINSFDLTKENPDIYLIGETDIDSQNQRLIGAHFEVKGHSYGEGEGDGVYVYSLKDGKQLAYIKTGKGVMGVRYNPKLDEIYAANFRTGTISVIDAKDYKVIHTITPYVPFPNMLALNADGTKLYAGLKQGFSRAWNPKEFIGGAKEQLLKVELLEK